MTRLCYPATARNREPILDVLRRILPSQGLVLELASGSGEHTAHFAEDLRSLEWQPTDLGVRELASIRSWTEHLPNVRPPVRLDATAEWPIDTADAVVCINMVHISPWSATLGLLAGAAHVLSQGAPLYLYGPYKLNGIHTAPSNAAFDQSLRSRDPSWGVRDLADVVDAAQHFELAERVEMPANNQSLVFRRK